MEERKKTAEEWGAEIGALWLKCLPGIVSCYHPVSRLLLRRFLATGDVSGISANEWNRWYEDGLVLTAFINLRAVPSSTAKTLLEILDVMDALDE